MEILDWIWLGGGFALMLMELLLPGLVVIWLGLGAVLVAGLRWLGIIEGLTPSFMVWFISSLSFLIFLRRFFTKYLPGEVTANYSDEDRDAFGAIVEIVESVTSGSDQGRIKYGGTTWSASCIEGEIKVGQKARITARDNLVWIVEPLEDSLLEEKFKQLPECD